MQQILIDFGVLRVFGMEIPVRIYGYGLMLVLGFLSGIYLAQWRAKRSGESPECIYVLGWLALIGGVVGARLAYVVEQWVKDPLHAPRSLGAVLNVTSGGLIYYGGMAGALLALWAYLRLKRLPIRRYGDILAVSFVVGLAFGRAGCLLNGCCYGGACSERWPLGMRFPMYSRPLVKLDSSPGPFSGGAQSPSPVFAHQWEQGLLGPGQVDQRLLNFRTAPPQPLAVRSLHGPLSREQLSVMLGSEANAHVEFDRLTGGQKWLGRPRWAEGLASGEAFLRGSEIWEEALTLGESRPGLLSFPEAWEYLQERKARLLGRFDEDRDGLLEGPQRQEADAYLRADVRALAAAQRSLPVKPAQALAIVNALVIAGILWGFYGLRWREGQVFALLLVLYPLTRIVEEAIRDDNVHSFRQLVFTHNQVVSMFIMIAGASIWLALRGLPPRAGGAARGGLAVVEVSKSSRAPRGPGQDRKTSLKERESR
jgi:prolipoprotein diacylglyceryltransferase